MSDTTIFMKRNLRYHRSFAYLQILIVTYEDVDSSVRLQALRKNLYFCYPGPAPIIVLSDMAGEWIRIVDLFQTCQLKSSTALKERAVLLRRLPISGRMDRLALPSHLASLHFPSLNRFRKVILQLAQASTAHQYRTTL